MKKIFSISSLLFVVMSYAQTNLTSSENYIYSKTCLNDNCSKVSENVQYLDSWGKPIQSIDIKTTPQGKDMVTHIEYDQFGRQAKSFLPVPQTGTQNGAIYTSPLSNAPSIYGAEKIYSEKVYENSPLDRVQQILQAGNDWSGKPVNLNYDANTDGEVRKYTISTSWFEGRTKYVIGNSGNYISNTLSKNSVTNEDGNTSIEFKNKKGQTVLTRKKDGNENIDTYYVYNEYGQLAYVIPPLASKSGAVDQTTLDNLCYQYHYDGWNRQVEKKLPGKGWEFMVYDKMDRLVMTQDANMKPTGKWFFTKYDKFSRILYTGIADIGAYTREQVQSSVNYYIEHGQPAVEERNNTGFVKAGMTVYYGNAVYPTTIDKVLSINYYDTYPPESPSRPVQVLNENTIGDNLADVVNTQNLPTASLLKNIEDDNWTKTYVWYDNKRRAIGTHSINHLGGYTRTDTLLDFTGVIKQSKNYHKRLLSDTENIISQNFEYDNQNRLKKHWHQVGSNPQELLSENSYNELSQLTNKKVGNNLQSLDYTYNIRGTITSMNNPTNLGNDLFGYSVSYFNPLNTANGKYSGNISEVSWRTSQDNVLRKYSYQYDALNRLTKGAYSEPDASVPQNDFYNETVTYDINSNITSLQRTGKNVLGLKADIDILTYSYAGNRLNSVTDSSTNYNGYPDVSGNAISYDNNGNMKDHKDKGALQIDYNFLNLPDKITFDQTYLARNVITGKTVTRNVTTSYIYKADGAKLRKVYKYGGEMYATEATLSTDYLDGFQYESQTASGPFTLKFVPTAEGYYNFENNKYIYSYTDHLGNVRLSYTKNGLGTEIIEENNFYPFGLKHEGYNQAEGNPSYNYGYNGKELQKETGWSDYGARMYMSDIGRWGVIDPLAEKMRRYSPYNYAFNNPVMFIDPDGMSPGQTSWMDGNAHWNFDPNTTIMGGAWFEGNYSLQNSFWNDAAGGSGGFGATTYYGLDGYNYLQSLLNQTYNFSQFDFTKYGFDDSGPENPIRKYLKQTTNSYFGAIESVDQYQLNHSNWIDEYQGTMEFLGTMKEYFESAGDHLGGAGYGTFAIDNLKTIKEVIEKFKNYNPSLASAIGFITGTVGTSLNMEGERFDQIMDIYKNASYRYDQLHKQDTSLNKGVTVNVNVIIGTNGGGYTNIMIYDISTHRYLSGGKIVHRN